jgi:prepilin-type N-terminal cleavage/methylation domain-containing protein
MRNLSRQRGVTMIESMAAVSVMLIGATGIAGLYTTGVRMNGDARRVTRATAIAQDLMNNLLMQPYSEGGGPFANACTANDNDIADSALNFETDDDPIVRSHGDHGEADITALGNRWYGIPAASLGGEYQRFWNVRYIDTNGDGINDAIQIAVIVRWPVGSGLVADGGAAPKTSAYRRVVLLGAQVNPVGY